MDAEGLGELKLLRAVHGSGIHKGQLNDKYGMLQRGKGELLLCAFLVLRCFSSRTQYLTSNGLGDPGAG